jgi:hypothetical protein
MAPSSNTLSELCALRLLRTMPKRARGPSIRNWVEPEKSWMSSFPPPFNGGSAVGEIFTFLSGLYFRGKLAYAEVFARPPRRLNSGVFVITPNGGLLAPSVRVTLDDLARLAKTDIDPSAKEFRKPLQKDAKALAQALGPRGEPILLGSIATRKYVDVLLSAFPQELLFPAEFVGRGDMSRGGLMLRSVDAHLELAYVPVRGAILRGARPPKLPPRSTRS